MRKSEKVKELEAFNEANIDQSKTSVVIPIDLTPLLHMTINIWEGYVELVTVGSALHASFAKPQTLPIHGEASEAGGIVETILFGYRFVEKL
jgi:hypothetical protein